VPPAEPSRRGELFDDVAEAYDDARRGYPPELVDTAIEQGGLGADSPVVEVGCGTGKLTEALVARGLHVDAVDPGPRMIDVARRRVGGSALVRFHVGRFEEVDLPHGSFDAVFSATAFHWIDPSVGWRKAAELLRPGGLLALLSHVPVADAHTAGFDEGFRELWATYNPDEPPWPPLRDTATLLADADRERANVSEVWDELQARRHGLAVPEAAHLFTGVEVRSASETVEETAETGLKVIRTTSGYLRIDRARRDAFEDDVRALYARLGGASRFPLLTVLVTAVKPA
jgi:SAM-dependent methyltransferase